MLMGLRRQIQQTANPLASAMAQGTGSQLDVAGIISSLPSRGGLFGRSFGSRPQGGGGLAGIAQRVRQGVEGGLGGEVTGGLQDLGPMRQFMESRQGGNTGGIFGGGFLSSMLAAAAQQAGGQGGVAAPGDPAAGAGPAANAFRAVGMFR
jgi:hypothetical protein